MGTTGAVMNEMTKEQKRSETLWHLLTVLFDQDALIREVAPGEYEIAIGSKMKRVDGRHDHVAQVDMVAG